MVTPFINSENIMVEQQHIGKSMEKSRTKIKKIRVAVRKASAFPVDMVLRHSVKSSSRRKEG